MLAIAVSHYVSAALQQNKQQQQHRKKHTWLMKNLCEMSIQHNWVMCSLSHPQKISVHRQRETWKVAAANKKWQSERVSMYLDSAPCTSHTRVGQNHHYQCHATRRPQLKSLRCKVAKAKCTLHCLLLRSNAPAMVQWLTGFRRGVSKANDERHILPMQSLVW